MFVPNHHLAVVPPEKVIGYLLAAEHRSGRGKAKFFISLGFRLERWQQLAEVLRQHVSENEVFEVRRTPFGQSYRVEGPLMTPGGQVPQVRSIWFIEASELVPRLTTAYPAPRRDA